jgi:hypothetical protein
MNLINGMIVRLDEDEKTPWQIIHIDKGGAPGPHAADPVWIRRMRASGKDILDLEGGVRHDTVVSINRIWVR